MIFNWYYKYLYILFIICQSWYNNTWHYSRIALFWGRRKHTSSPLAWIMSCQETNQHRPRSLVWNLTEKYCSGWFVVREKHCSTGLVNSKLWGGSAGWLDESRPANWPTLINLSILTSRTSMHGRIHVHGCGCGRTHEKSKKQWLCSIFHHICTHTIKIYAPTRLAHRP